MVSLEIYTYIVCAQRPYCASIFVGHMHMFWHFFSLHKPASLAPINYLLSKIAVTHVLYRRREWVEDQEALRHSISRHSQPTSDSNYNQDFHGCVNTKGLALVAEPIRNERTECLRTLYRNKASCQPRQASHWLRPLRARSQPEEHLPCIFRVCLP